RGLRDERREPADFQLEADDDQEICVAELEEETRFRLDEMRVLVAACDGLRSNLVAADFLRERGKVGRCRHDLNLAVGADVGRACGKNQCQRYNESSNLPKNSCFKHRASSQSFAKLVRRGAWASTIDTLARTDARRVRPSRKETGTAIRSRWYSADSGHPRDARNGIAYGSD